MVYAGCVVVVVMERVGVVVVRRACGWMQGIWSPKLKQVSTEKWKKKIHGAPGSLPCPHSICCSSSRCCVFPVAVAVVVVGSRLFVQVCFISTTQYKLRQPKIQHPSTFSCSIHGTNYTH